MRFRYMCLAIILVIMVATHQPLAAADNSIGSWRDLLRNRISAYGHRNWIVIADSAYPIQTSNGIETIVSNADHFEVLQTVLKVLGESKHVRPIPYTDRELEFVDESEAPGISEYRRHLSEFFRDRQATSLLHDQIISKLNQVSQSFRVLIIKTNMVLPYTSIFLQLDCAYWKPEAERRLRRALANSAGK